jgi:hypothetical protein
MSSPIVDMSCLLEKPAGSVIRHLICFHRTRQTIIQLPRIVWSSADPCHQEDWDTWPASRRYTHFGGEFVHFAQKYWHPVRFIKGRRCCIIQMKSRTMVFQFKNGETIALPKSPIEKTSNGMKSIGHRFLLQLIFAGTAHRSQGMALQRAAIDCRM